MRFVTYADDGAPTAGVVLPGDAERVLALRWAAEALGAPAALEPEALADLPSLFATGPAGLDAVRELVEDATRGDTAELSSPLAELRPLAPIPRPPRLRDYLTYQGHASGADFELAPVYDELPVGYDGNPNSVIGPDDEIPWPAYTEQLDYELELAIVIGMAGRDIPVARAHEHIAGVTLLNDVSARDIQGHEMTGLLGPAKGKHFCNVLGPAVMTLDGVEDDLRMEARVNGEIWSTGRSGGRAYSLAEIVAWASFGEDLQPGEILGVGTIAGGCGLELGRWLAPGDVVELELEGMGVLRNRVGERASAGAAGIPSYTGSPPFKSPTST